MICNQITTKWNPQTRHNDELTVSLLDFTQPIDNAKTYPAGNTTYPFQIKIPANILDKPKIPDGFAGTLVRTAEALNHTPVTIQWWLIARLSVKGIDTVKQINILVG